MTNMRFSAVMGITFAVTSIVAIFGCSPETIQNNDVLRYLSNASKLLGCRGCKPPDSEDIAGELNDSFDVADENNDGLLSLAEAQTVFIALTEEEFEALDRNGDGFLSREELNVTTNPNEVVEGEEKPSESVPLEEEEKREGEISKSKNEPIEELTILLPGNVPLVMVRIPAGMFMMGRYVDESGSNTRESPQHKVTIPQDFYMGKYEVTKRQWQAMMGTMPWEGERYIIDDLDSPAVWVSWHDAKDFITMLNIHIMNTGQGATTFRLPSQAEWEYACRAGTTTRFYWGDDPSYTVGNDYCWWYRNSRQVKEMWAHVVGLKLPNAFGLYDMSGNVWEWCEEEPHQNYIGAPVDGSAWIDSPRGRYRIFRGGGCFDPSHGCRSASFNYTTPTSRNSNLGFRIAW